MLCYTLVISHMPVPPKSIDISPKLWIGLYNYLAYISICISLRHSDVDMSRTSSRLPTLPTHSISVNVMARPCRHPGHLTFPLLSLLIDAYLSTKFLHSTETFLQSLCSCQSTWPSSHHISPHLFFI